MDINNLFKIMLKTIFIILGVIVSILLLPLAVIVGIIVLKLSVLGLLAWFLYKCCTTEKFWKKNESPLD